MKALDLKRPEYLRLLNYNKFYNTLYNTKMFMDLEIPIVTLFNY